MGLGIYISLLTSVQAHIHIDEARTSGVPKYPSDSSDCANLFVELVLFLRVVMSIGRSQIRNSIASNQLLQHPIQHRYLAILALSCLHPHRCWPRFLAGCCRVARHGPGSAQTCGGSPTKLPRFPLHIALSRLHTTHRKNKASGSSDVEATL